MSGLKSVLCLYDGEDDQLNALDMALGLSVKHQGFVHTLHVIEPIDPYLELNAAQEARVVESQSLCAEHVRSLVQKRAWRHGRSLWHGHLASQEFYATGIGFEALTGYAEKIFPRVARTNDLVVCSRARVKKEATPDAFMSTLLRSGRPILLVPSHNPITQPGELFDRIIAVAWDRSIQATRAIHNLIPFLGKDCQLHIISIAEPNKKIDVRDDPAIIYWLKRHGLDPIVHLMEQEDYGVGDLLLAKASEIGAGVLVAGAYGHNAIVEKLIGGTTIDLYRRAQIPLFLNH